MNDEETESPLTNEEEAEARLDIIQSQIILLRKQEAWLRIDLRALERVEIALHNLIKLMGR